MAELSKEQIAADREICRKATPGPYMIEPINGGETYQVTTCQSTGFTVICETECGEVQDLINMEFFIAARTQWPIYIDAVDKLRAAIIAKLKDCREVGGCSDAALMEGEYCSDECATLARLTGGKGC